MEQKPFCQIDTFIKEHVRTILEESDYQGKDEQENPIYEHKEDYPIITYSATHKVGGTNTSIRLNSNNYFYQSRNSILAENTNTSDQNGFRATFEKIDLSKLFKLVKDKYNLKDEEIIIYGEWCGNGIKDNHSISQAKTKQWIIFAVKISDEYVDNFVELSDEENGIYNILKWGAFKVIIDYNQFQFGCWKDSNGDLPQNLKDLVDLHTLQCPVSKFFGINGKGEGLVLKSDNYISKRTNEFIIVKIKNSEYDKPVVKQVIEKTTNPKLDEFLKEAVKPSRLEQFCNYMENQGDELTMKNVVKFQLLVLIDIEKECSKIAKDLNLTVKDYESSVRKNCTDYLKNKIKL